MSLLTGNVVNELGVGIDCEYKLLHYEQEVVSNVRNTELQQWNIDTDDADLNNNGAAFAVGDIAIIGFWTEDACAVVKVDSTGADSYVFDVQLKGCMAPTAGLNVADVNVGSPLVAVGYGSDEYQWVYNGVTHYHKSSWYGETWCTSVGVQSVEYDFGSGWQTSGTGSVVNTAGEYSVQVRVTNICGLTAIAEKVAKVRWRAPQVSIVTSIETPKVGEEITIDVATLDIDSRVTEQVIYLDGVEIENNEVHTFDIISDREIRVETTWNDGFEDKTIVTTKVLNMEAAAVEVELDYSNEEYEYSFTSDVTLGDGNLVSKRYKIEFKLPMKDTFEVVYTGPSGIVNEPYVVTFTSTGTYRVTVEVEDEYGSKGTDVEEINVVCLGGAGEGVCETEECIYYIEWE